MKNIRINPLSHSLSSTQECGTLYGDNWKKSLNKSPNTDLKSGFDGRRQIRLLSGHSGSGPSPKGLRTQTRHPQSSDLHKIVSAPKTDIIYLTDTFHIMKSIKALKMLDRDTVTGFRCARTRHALRVLHISRSDLYAEGR